MGALYRVCSTAPDRSARVVDQDVDAPVALGGSRDDLAYPIFVGDVTGPPGHSIDRVELGDQRLPRLGQALLVTCDEDNGRTVADESPRGGRTYPRRSAGDQDDRPHRIHRP